MLFQQTKLENDLKNMINKATYENSYLYYDSVKSSLEKGISGADAYKDAPDAIVKKVNELAKMEMHSRPEILERYNEVLANPQLSGYKFQYDILTVGKIYLFFVWAFSGRKGKKKNCIEIDGFFSQCCLEQRKRVLDEHKKEERWPPQDKHTTAVGAVANLKDGNKDG